MSHSAFISNHIKFSSDDYNRWTWRARVSRLTTTTASEPTDRKKLEWVAEPVKWPRAARPLPEGHGRGLRG
jgi:hypothetical protein